MSGSSIVAEEQLVMLIHPMIMMMILVMLLSDAEWRWAHAPSAALPLGQFEHSSSKEQLAEPIYLHIIGL